MQNWWEHIITFLHNPVTLKKITPHWLMSLSWLKTIAWLGTTFISPELVANKTHTYKTHTETLYKRLFKCKRGRKRERRKGRGRQKNDTGYEVRFWIVRVFCAHGLPNKHMQKTWGRVNKATWEKAKMNGFYVVRTSAM